MKRFYKDVSTKFSNDGYEVLLDGRPIKTPCEKNLSLPTKALAKAVKTEWSSQGENIDVLSMPITRIANTSIDRTRDFFDEIVNNLLKYANTDLVCYIAKNPEELKLKQERQWLSALQWFNKKTGANLKHTYGIMPITQEDFELKKVRDYITSLELDFLTALYLSTEALGSLVLATGFCERHLDAKKVYSLAFLDEEFQESYWGKEDQEQKRREKIKEEINNLEYYMTLLEEV